MEVFDPEKKINVRRQVTEWEEALQQSSETTTKKNTNGKNQIKSSSQ